MLEGWYYSRQGGSNRSQNPQSTMELTEQRRHFLRRCGLFRASNEASIHDAARRLQISFAVDSLEILDYTSSARLPIPACCATHHAV